MYSTPVCAPCDDLDFPATTNNCVPEQNESEIAYMFLSVPSSGDINVPAITSPNFSTPAVATTFVAPSGAMLQVIGDLPEPESSQRVGSGRRILRDKKNFTVNFTIDDTTDENYEFLRTLECSPSVFVWFMTLGGKVYGAVDNGIPGMVSKANAPLDRGAGTYERFEVSINWRAWGHPPRQNGWLYTEQTT